MEPRIRYAKTSDGVSIAYWTLGEGPPFVMMPPMPFSHVQLEWKMAAYVRWYEHYARERQLLRYDPRGAGLSQRDVRDFSLEAQLRDLTAVIDSDDLPPFALWAFGPFGGAIGVTYAARFPERVKHLILFSPAPSEVRTGVTSALESMQEQDWELWLKTASHVVMGWPRGDLAGELRAIMVEAVTPKTAAAVGEAAKHFDITPRLADVPAPTLVIARRQAPVPLDAVTSVAAGLPNARLVVLEGDSMAFLDDPEVVTAVDQFLSEGERLTDESASAPSGLLTILFTDMESSTALRRKLGDAKVQELVRAHNEIVRAAVGEHSGREIKHTGDGIMASFTTATSALECAIAIQQGVASHIEAHPDAPLGVYIGLNAGEPIAEERDLFGTSVDLAKRICEHAEPGQILASNVVRELSEGKGFLFSDLGDVVPKGFEDPVKLWEVRWREDG